MRFRFDPERRFGVEIEGYNVDRHEVAEVLSQRGLPCIVEVWNQNTRPYWKVVTDGSIEGGLGFELVSPPLQGKNGLAEMTLALDTLREIGAKMNATTGFHVHHDAGDLKDNQMKQIIYSYGLYFNHFKKAFEDHRFVNEYCSLFTCVSAAVATLEPGSRRVAVNPYARDVHGTLEFRQHHGTLYPLEAKSWVIFTQQFVNRSLEPTAQTRVNDSVQHLIWWLDTRGHKMEPYECEALRYMATRCDWPLRERGTIELPGPNF